MFENINVLSSVAVYVQIENHVQFAVASGRLKPGERLPSILELAKKLKVNLNTVVKSYRELEVMGILYTRRGSGAFVKKGAEVKCRENCRQRTVARLHEVVAEARAAGMSPQEVKAVCTASYASAADPYAETPASVLAAAKLK
jgi:GntR family transcriptional regulator